MNGESSSGASRCEDVQELLAWYPAGHLDPDEIARVREHVAGCGICRDALRAAGTLAGQLASTAPHPRPDSLIRLVESPDALTPRERRLVTAHVAVCRACADEVDILRQLDESTASATTGLAQRLRSVIGRTLLRPVPAAAYLMVAIAFGGWIASRPPTAVNRAGSPGESVMTVGGITLIGDERRPVRGPSPEEPVVTISSHEMEFLVLELMGPGSAPDPASRFEVTLTRSGYTDPSWRGTVSGERFRDSHAIGIAITPDALAPGAYLATVRDPTGRVVHRASFRVDG